MRALGSFLLIAATSSCTAQSLRDWTIGIFGGYGFYHNATFKNSLGSAEAGFHRGWAAGAVITEDVAEYFGGELRYTFRESNLKLRSSGTEANMDAMTHIVHYDFVFYGMPRSSRLRPYAAVGGGIKYYVGDGRESAVQPLANFGLLSHTNEVVGMASFGGGVKYRIGDRWQVRVDFRDYASPFPKKLIAPAANVNVSGWIHDFVPTVGVDWVIGTRR
jgi:hypothetical protein